MSDYLRVRPASTAGMMAVFSDSAAIAHALAFEAALAQAEAAEGLIATADAAAIVALCDTVVIDPAELAEDAALAGTLAIPLVRRLRAALAGNAAEALHRGATSQDVADTILMSQARDATQLLLTDCARIVAALADLAQHHAETPAIGRTLLQDALPIGFGLRLAQAAAGIAGATDALHRQLQHGFPLQLGGAAGTRAGLGGRGEAVAAHMATTLGLATCEPWHARRICTATLAASLGILIGALGKLARDISLLAQNGVGEAREPAIEGRDGSSAMAHKRNPTGCQISLACRWAA